MSNYKAVLTLILLVLLLFGIFVNFSNDYVEPAATKVGEGFLDSIDTTFEGIDTSVPGS